MVLNRFQSIKKTKNGYYISGDHADVKIIFMSDDVIRIRTSFDRKFEEVSYALVTTAWDDALDSLFKKERMRITPLNIPFKETEKEIIFKTAKGKLVLYKESLHFQMYNVDGDLVYQDKREGHFYGFGTPFSIWIHDQKKYAVGLFYHNSHSTVFGMSNEYSGDCAPYCCCQADGGDQDLFLIAGPDVVHVLERYTWLTGRSAMPTKQSLGYTASARYDEEPEKDCDQKIYNVIQKHFDAGFYMDNFCLSSGYSSGEDNDHCHVFCWNRDRFPDPKAFFEKISSMGINVIPNLNPGILPNHPHIKLFEANDIFLKDSTGTKDYIRCRQNGSERFFDFTNRNSRNIWKELLKAELLAKGSRSVWNDDGKCDRGKDCHAVCGCGEKAHTMSEVRLIHSNVMAHVGKEALSEMYPNERPYIINHDGYAGIQRYAQVWSTGRRAGWEALKENISTIVRMGLSGVANCGVIIGESVDLALDGELLLRGIQSGIFQPGFCVNFVSVDHTVTRPWIDEGYLNEIRSACAQRYRMIPYLYSLMRQAYESGIPAMRPLFMEFPDDENCYEDKNLTFMFGPSVLVANVVEKGARTRTFYLPKGTVWYDMNDHMKAYEGGQTMELPVSLSSIPMFLRGSAVYMTTEDVHQASTDIMRQLDFIISVKEDHDFIFYDDDGLTRDFEKGVYSRIKIFVKTDDTVSITFDKEGTYEDTVEQLTFSVISKERRAFQVSVDGDVISRFQTKEHFESTEVGWYDNLSDGVVMIKCPNPQKGRFDIVVSFE